MELRLFTVFVSILLSSLAHADAKFCQKEIQIPSMGTFFEVQYIEDCQIESGNLALEIRAILDVLESEFSLYQAHSPLSRLNQSGELDNSSEVFRQVLRLSLDQEKKTMGKFNIAVLPVLSLVRQSFLRTGKPPPVEAMKKLRSLVSTKDIQIEGQKIRLRQKGMQLTLDGIVKGYAVDQVAAALQAKRFENFLLNFSGNMKWQGHKAIGEKWQVRSWNPIHSRMESVQVADQGSIASSGSEHNSYSKDQKWNHLIDPQNFSPQVRWSQTTVIGPEAMLCDVLSTASFLMSRKQMQMMLKKYFPLYQIYTVDRKGRFEQIRRT